MTAVEVALAAARAAHYAALTAFFGVALFPLYAGCAADRRALVWAAAATPISGVLWLAAVTAGMAGDLAAAFDPATLWSVLRDTEFGRIWAVRLLIGGIAVVAVLRGAGDRGVVLLSGLLLASLAFTGHARSPEGGLGVAHAGADALHLLAAGAWIGGLIPLAGLMKAEPAEPRGLGEIVARFSRMGYVAVASLAGTGLFNAWLLVGAPRALVATAYGQTLVVKLLLFAVMLALAATNRFWISPALGRGEEGAKWRGRLGRRALLEFGLGLLVLLAVARLGVLEPGAAQAAG